MLMVTGPLLAALDAELLLLLLLEQAEAARPRPTRAVTATAMRRPARRCLCLLIDCLIIDGSFRGLVSTPDATPLTIATVAQGAPRDLHVVRMIRMRRW
jgi:hypothetical protein